MKGEKSNMNFVTESSPHIRRRATAYGMMADVLIALIPVILFSIGYGWWGVRNIIFPVLAMEIAEFCFVLIRNKGSFKERVKAYSPLNALTSAISGIIFGLMLPATNGPMMYFYLIIGALFGIIIGKLVFGGTGSNIFNPAAVAFVFTQICFGSSISSMGNFGDGAVHNFWIDMIFKSADVNTGATLLSSSSIFASPTPYTNISLLDLLLGNTAGAMGEVCKLAILIGLVYLLVRRAADWRVVAGFALTFIVLTFIAGLFVTYKGHAVDNPFLFVAYMLLSGGVLYGMTYMITDPVTMPIDAPARVSYGMLIAVFALFMRFFAANPEGVVYAILIMNAVATFLDYAKWSHSQFNKKDIIVYVCIAAVAILVICLGVNSKIDAFQAK